MNDYVKAIQDAGFEGLINKNASDGGYLCPIIEKADKFFTLVLILIKVAVKLRILPGHFIPLFNRLNAQRHTLVGIDQMGLTTAWYLVARKKKEEISGTKEKISKLKGK